MVPLLLGGTNMPEKNPPIPPARRPRGKRAESSLPNAVPSTADDRQPMGDPAAPLNYPPAPMSDPTPPAIAAAPAETPAEAPADAVARRAYEIFAEEGWQHGRDVDHWLRAEREIRGTT
jgi:hypothetical protein